MHTTETLEINYLHVLLADRRELSLAPMQQVYPKPELQELAGRNGPILQLPAAVGSAGKNLPTLPP